MLVARPGTTLESLYQQIYRGVTAPPFKDVQQLNPAPFKPGAVLFFPAPVGGWRPATRH
jgi:hypothetical protein